MPREGLGVSQVTHRLNSTIDTDISCTGSIPTCADGKKTIMITRIETAPVTTSGMQLARLARRGSQPTYELSYVEDNEVHTTTLPPIESPIISAPTPHESMVEALREGVNRREQQRQRELEGIWGERLRRSMEHTRILKERVDRALRGEAENFTDDEFFTVGLLYGWQVPAIIDALRRERESADLPDIGDAWLDD